MIYLLACTDPWSDLDLKLNFAETKFDVELYLNYKIGKSGNKVHNMQVKIIWSTYLLENSEKYFWKLKYMNINTLYAYYAELNN